MGDGGGLWTYYDLQYSASMLKNYNIHIVASLKSQGVSYII